MTIFVVTVFGQMDPARHRHQRTWGWYATWAEAERAIRENHTDMFEALYYDTAVIEEFDQGVLADSIERGWFRAVSGPGERNEPWLHPTVTKIDRPEWARGTVHWGMG